MLLKTLGTTHVCGPPLRRCRCFSQSVASFFCCAHVEDHERWLDEPRPPRRGLSSFEGLSFGVDAEVLDEVGGTGAVDVGDTGALSEAVDFPKNIVKKNPKTNRSMTPSDSLKDCLQDLDANDGGRSAPPGVPCTDWCKVLAPTGFTP